MGTFRCKIPWLKCSVRQYMSTHFTISKAIFPVAGLGTRFLPATKACPKEMLPVVDKPLIQYAVEEAYAAGIREMIFVTGRNKRAIEDHFDTAYELEAELLLDRKDALIKLLNDIKPSDMDCVYIRQPKALGLGHAVLCAEKLVRNEPFAVLLADDLMIGKPPVMKQMIDLFNQHQSSILAVQNVQRAHTDRYGIAQGNVFLPGLVQITKLIEKPAPSIAPSTLAVAGRYVLTPAVFDHLRKQSVGIGKEIQLTDAIDALLANEKVLAYSYQGKRYDCGSKLGLLQANVDLGMCHPEFGMEFQVWLNAKNTLIEA